jgi:hypothetical protein
MLRIFKRSSALFLLCTATMAVQADEGAESSAETFATVSWAKGKPSAYCVGCAPRVLQKGMTVKVGDTISTDLLSEVHLITQDQGGVAVRANSQFLVESYQAKGRSDDRQWLKLAKGSFRAVSGWASRLNRDTYRITTPTATIGIRGTDHEPFVVESNFTFEGHQHPSGTYDKVNTGGTELVSIKGKIDIAPSQVGFVAAAGTGSKKRMLFALLPRILKERPNFYLPGANEAAFDAFAKSSQARLDAAQAQACLSAEEVRATLAQVDAAMIKEDLEGVMQAFADAVDVELRLPNDKAELDVLRLNRQDLRDSTEQSFAAAENYAIESQELALQTGFDGDCAVARLSRRSVESGVFNGTATRLESEQRFDLEKVEGAIVIRQMVIEQKR